MKQTSLLTWVVSILIYCKGGDQNIFVDAFSSLASTGLSTQSRVKQVQVQLGSSKRSSETSSDTSTSSEATAENTLEFELHSSIADISEDDWNECVACNQTSSAFLDHSWLLCLEESGCASPKSGWVPQHISMKDDNGQTIGFVPMYIKGHSMGEFIFDNAWAEAAYQNGIEYYPKMLVAVPFTPATGNRILWHPSVYDKYSEQEIARLRQLVAQFLLTVAASNKLSSVHINFMTEKEALDIGGELGDMSQKQNQTIQEQIQEMLLGRRKIIGNDVFLRRTSVQYHWSNRNPNNEGKRYKSFDEYLQNFKSKRRINIRRERRKVREDEGIRVDAIRGKEILKYPGLMEKMFEIYRSTIDKMYYGRQYLTLEFFQRLAKSDFVDNLCFMCARYDATNTSNVTNAETPEFCADDVFAGTFNVIKDGVFVGRYWGCVADEEIKNLHFETCYWAAIEYCIEQGLDRMEPGTGGGDYKWARGFDPALIHSAHYICHPGLRSAIAEYVEYETEENMKASDFLQWRRSRGKSERENATE